MSLNWKHRPEVSVLLAASFPTAALPITSNWRRDSAQRCVGGCCTVTQEDRGLEEKHFSGFSQTHRLFSHEDITHKTNNTPTNMKNPLYWAMLVGMSILLMEQGKIHFVMFGALVLVVSASVWMGLLLHLFSPKCPCACLGQCSRLHLTSGCLPYKLQLKWSD